MRFYSGVDIDVFAILQRDAGEQREAIIAGPQFAPDLFLLAQPATSELPYVGIGRIVTSSPTEPLIGAVQHPVGGKLRDNRHIGNMMTGAGNYNNVAGGLHRRAATSGVGPFRKSGAGLATSAAGGKADIEQAALSKLYV